MAFRLALFSLLVALNSAQHILEDSTSCEFYARQIGQPLDGWRVLHDANEGPNCIREPVDLHCTGRQFYDPETRIARCCQPSGNIAWFDEQAKLGYCCAEEHEWSGDLATGDGGCCPIGLQMINGECRSLGSHTPPAREEESILQPVDNQSAQIHIVKTPLSIQYGRCYTISAGGKQIGSTRENTLYRLGGLFQDIPFRVCKSTNDCTIGESVLFQQIFYLQDQIGSYSDPAGRMGWIAADRRALRMRFTLNEKEAEAYQGSMICVNPGCAISLSGVPQAFHFNEVVCETDLQPFITHRGGGQTPFHQIPVEPGSTERPSCH